MSIFLETINAIYATSYKLRLKTCSYCGVEYSDVTRRNTGKTCSKACGYNYGVSVRKQKGSYVQTNEQKEKIRKSCKKTWETREVFTKEHIKKFSDTMKKTWREGKIDTKNHWSKSEEAKKKISQWSKKQVISLESRRKMSISQQLRVRSKKDTLYSSAKGGIRPDIGMYFRSNWEANFARIMNHLNKNWEYEPHNFQLSENMSYLPDFLVEGVYYEIKGRMTELCQLKIDLFRKQNPTLELIVVDHVQYNLYREQYKCLIPDWEGN